MDDRLIATVPKNKREEIRVALCEFKGHRTIDLRVYALNSDGDKVPTTKGVAIKPTLLPDIIAALSEAERKARTLGLMEADA